MNRFLDYYNEDKSNDKKDSSRINERKSQSDREPSPPTSRKVSDDVFLASDITTTNDNESQEHSDPKTDLSTVTRPHTRNWADCPIDESVVETSPTFRRTSTEDVVDNFQVCELRFFFYRDKIRKKHNLYRMFVTKFQNHRHCHV